jgi:hypothetical protein
MLGLHSLRDGGSSFHISKLDDLKVIHDLYSQYLTQTLSKTTSFTKPEGVYTVLLKLYHSMRPLLTYKIVIIFYLCFTSLQENPNTSSPKKDAECFPSGTRC